MAEFLDSVLFHWTAERAIWVGGHTLSWDARCAGIYAGFAAGALYQLIAGWRRWALPPLRVLAAAGLLALPLFVHVASLYLGYAGPAVNELRWGSGLLFGSALSVALVPALAVLYRRAVEDGEGATLRYFAPILLPLVAAFLLPRWDSIVAFALLQSLSWLGFVALACILAAGMARALRILAISLFLGACATTPPPEAPRACEAASFVASPVAPGLCRREACVEGRVALVEDLKPTAPVDDWAEERFCLANPFSCLQAHELKEKTEQWQREQVGKRWAKSETRYGIADAARHAYLMCLVTEKLGAEFARGLGKAHEEDSEYLVFFRHAAPGNPCCEKVQDLYNNEVGIALAGQPGACEEKVLASLHLLRHSLCAQGRTGTEY